MSNGHSVFFPDIANIKSITRSDLPAVLIGSSKDLTGIKSWAEGALKYWIDNYEIKSGKLFDISDKSIALIIKKYASLAGLDPNKYGGHSLRSGFATSAAESGAEERNIMAMTGHKTTQMVRRYIPEANLFKNNALNKIKI